MWLIAKISGIIIYPIIAVLETAMPDLTNIIFNIENFLDTYFWSTAGFVKRVMVNFGVPQAVFTFIITWYTFRITMAVGIRGFALISNLYKKFKP